MQLNWFSENKMTVNYDKFKSIVVKKTSTPVANLFHDRKYLSRYSLRESCLNTEFFLVRIFPHLD